jgi:LPXTG-site transpeptidase (sortase) family protein
MLNNSCSPSLANILFSNNSVSGQGGGMYSFRSDSLLTNVTFNHNNSAGEGGGMFNIVSNPTLINVTFTSNSATTQGGGVYNNFNNTGNITFTNVIFNGNSADWGGGIYNLNSGPSNPVISSATFSNNSAIIGGGMYNGSSNPDLTNVTFTYNSAQFGGGIYNEISNPLLTDVTFSGNSVTDYGGGIYNYSSNPILTNVTFNGNSSSNFGGGMSNSLSSPQIRNTIFWGNTAIVSGAQIYNSNSAPVLNNSIIQGGCSSGNSCTNLITTDPILGVLGDYGGFTQTIPLLPGSSALDRGNGATCPTTDQRGKGRVGTCDIGAFESQGFKFGAATGTPQSALINTAFSNSLGLTVTANAALEPVKDGLVTFTAPSSGASTTSAPTVTASIASDGTISKSITSNGLVGSYKVTASSAGIPTTVDFSLTNRDIPIIAQGASIGVTMSEDGSPIAWSTPTITSSESSLTWSLDTQAVHGVATVSGTGISPTITYVPALNYNGTDSFVAKVTNSDGSDTIIVNVTINPVNDAPTITGQAALSTTEDTALTIAPGNLTVTDVDNTYTSGFSLTVNNGTNYTVVGTTITPASNYNGALTVPIFVNDGTANSNTYNLSVTVNAQNDAPVITEGNLISVTMSEDGSPTAFSLTLNALDVDSGTMTWSISGTAPAAHGLATASGTGASKVISYVPELDYYGADSFDVLVSDGSLVDTITVNITINAVADTSTTNLISSLNPSIFNESVTFTATPSAGTGKVTFKENASNIIGCVNVSLSSGKATCTTSLLAIGTHVITAEYAGDSNYLGSTSNQVDQLVRVGMSINDVTKSEGNSGSTTYTFTITLSAPAPAGGVSFDIGTSANTAVAGSDFTAKSSIGKTISVGNSTTNFDVLVNGDILDEQDETFFVNLTNVINASLIDGQGQGTIINDDIPSVVMSSVTTDFTRISPIPVIVTFSENVTGFGASDIVPGNGVIGNFVGSGSMYTFNLTPLAEGLVTADIAAGVAAGLLHTNTAAVQFRRTYDDTSPSIRITTILPNYRGWGPATFTITFSENVNNAGGGASAHDVTNPVNYRIINKGANGAVDTGTCADPLAGDDTQMKVRLVVYIPNTAVVSLDSPLPVGNYRIFICGTTSIVDLAGNHFNGGKDSTFDITVLPADDSLLPNTGFAPHVVTRLPAQPEELAYTKMGDLWLEIPSQQVKANIVGVPQSENIWDVKWLGMNAGWLNGTAFPSWEGNSVITAHVTDANGLPGPFAGLKDLKYGDQLVIHLSGQRYIFEIRNTKLVRPEITTFAFEHLEDYSYLTLITCQGFDTATNTYLFRQILRAVLVSVK